MPSKIESGILTLQSHPSSILDSFLKEMFVTASLIDLMKTREIDQRMNNNFKTMRAEFIEETVVRPLTLLFGSLPKVSTIHALSIDMKLRN